MIDVKFLQANGSLAIHQSALAFFCYHKITQLFLQLFFLYRNADEMKPLDTPLQSRKDQSILEQENEKNTEIEGQLQLPKRND